MGRILDQARILVGGTEHSVHGLSRALSVAGRGILFLLSFFVFTGVVLRYVFNAPLLGGFEISQFIRMLAFKSFFDTDKTIFFYSYASYLFHKLYEEYGDKYGREMED